MTGIDLSSRRWVQLVLRGLCIVALLAASSAAVASEYHGLVTFGGLPVPGATVTVTEGAKKFVTVTDTQGFYNFPNLTDGAATVQVEMTGFAPTEQTVTIAPDVAMGKLDLKLLSLDAMRTTVKPVLSAGITEVQTRSEPTKTAAAPKPQGAPGSPPPPPPPPPSEEVAQRASEGILVNGSVNNAATSPFSLAAGFGNTRSGRSLYNYGFNLSATNSALNAKPYSLSGVDTSIPNTSLLTGGFQLQGPIKIPHLLRNGPNLQIGYQRTQNSIASTTSGIVPDAAERTGDFSHETNAAGQPIVVYNPATGQPYTGDKVPVSSQAAALLNLYPLPNINGSAGYNYQIPLISDTHSDALNSNVNKNLGMRNNLYGAFQSTSTRSSNGNLFDFVDTTNTLGMSSEIRLQHRFTPRLGGNVDYQFSRLSNRTTPYWANRANVSAQAGISGNDQDPAYWGPPTLGFAQSGTSGLTDGNSSFTRNATNAISVLTTWTHSPHNFTAGVTFNRRQFNYLSQANPRGTFSFTGQATSGGVTGGGSDVADFLIGVPDTSQIGYGNADKYLRQSVYAAYINDDWRVSPVLTVNMGARWDYGAPVTEIKNRLVNLDVASGFTAIAPVLASSPTGTVTGQKYPNSLVRPDRHDFGPQIGLSWRPIPGSSMVIGAGYSLRYDTSVYQAPALLMAQQAPLSTSVTAQNSAACPLTLASGFNQCATITADNFAIDPDFRVGYAHSWNLHVQRDLPGSLQMVATYNGIKGTRGVQEFLPNTNPTGAVNPCPSCPVGFKYLTSNGNSTRESGQVQLRRRLHSGFTAGATYTYSKSIDDFSSFGGQGASTGGSLAQDWRNLNGERALSNFDQRHLLNATVQYTTGMGLAGGTLLSGWRGQVYKEWTFLTTITAGSGTPQSPQYASIPVAGYTGVVRPNYTGASIYAAPAGLHLNPAAFTAPATGQWGDARRNSITGPDQFSLDATANRTFRYKNKYTLDLQIVASNALNHVTFPGWIVNINSAQFGTPSQPGSNSQRQLQINARVRF